MKLAMPVSLTSILWVKRLAIRLSRQADKSLVIPQAGEEANESLREFYVNEETCQDKLELQITEGGAGFVN